MTDLSINSFHVDQSGWKKVRFGDVVYEPKESVKDPLAEGIIHVVGLEHIDSEDIHLRRSSRVEDGTTFTKRFRKGDLLFGRRRAYLKKAAIAEFDGICSGDIIVMRAREEHLLPELLAFLVNNDKFFDYAVTHSAGGLSPRVKFKDLSNYSVCVPDKASQRNVLELLLAADGMLCKDKALEKSSIRAYRSLKENLFFGREEESKEHNSKLKIDVSQEIRFVPLGDVIDSIKYGTSKKANDFCKGYPIIGIPNVIGENLSVDNVSYVELDEKEYQSSCLKNGDIVIVRTNGNPEYTGRSALYDRHDGHVFASYLIKITVNKSLIDADFLLRYLQTDTARRYFQRHATSSAGNYNINTETIKAIPVPMMDFSVQQEIVRKLLKIEEVMQRAKGQHIVAKSLAKGFISEVF